MANQRQRHRVAALSTPSGEKRWYMSLHSTRWAAPRTSTSINDKYTWLTQVLQYPPYKSTWKSGRNGINYPSHLVPDDIAPGLGVSLFLHLAWRRAASGENCMEVPDLLA